MDVIVAFGLAFLAEVILSVLRPELAPPRWAPTQGGFVGISLLAVSRSLFPPRAKLPPDASPTSLPQIRWKAEELAREIRRSTRVYLVASALFSLIASYFIFTGSPKMQAASCLILIVPDISCGAFPKRGYVDFDGDIESYRRELRRQRAFLQRASVFHYVSLLPGVMILLLGSPVYLYWLPLVVLMLAELNHRATERLQIDLDDLNATGLRASQAASP